MSHSLPEIGITEPTRSWRLEQLVRSIPLILLFSSNIQKSVPEQGRRINYLKRFCWGWHVKRKEFTIIYGFLLQETRACIFSTLPPYRGIQAFKKELECWGAQSMLDHWLPALCYGTSTKEVLGRLLGFLGPILKTTLLGCFISGALQHWQMPSHFIMLQSRWQKSVAATRNCPQPSKNRVLKGKVWHTESSKHKKAKPPPNHFCSLWACQSRADFLNRKGYIMLEGNELQGTGKGNASGDLWHHWKQALYCQIRSKTTKGCYLCFFVYQGRRRVCVAGYLHYWHP